MVEFKIDAVNRKLLLKFLKDNPQVLAPKINKKTKEPPKNYFLDIPDEYGIIRPDIRQNVHSMPVNRVPGHILGYRVLGRCYTGCNLIQVRDDLCDADFEEVAVHELKHAFSPWLSEYQVRFWTRAIYPHSRYN